MLDDVRRIKEPWIFHLADDIVLPDAVNAWSVDTILDAAVRRNVSLVSLADVSFGIWFSNSTSRSRPLLVDVRDPPAALSSVSGRVAAGCSSPVSALEFYRPHHRSHYVVHQQPCLFARAALIALLELVPDDTSPQEWESLYNQAATKRRVGHLLERALTVRYATADALQQAAEVGHGGSLRRGWGLCVWQHAALQLGLPPAALPIVELPPGRWGYSQRNPLNDSGYSFCRVRADGVDGAASGATEPEGAVSTATHHEAPGARACVALTKDGHSVLATTTRGPCRAVALMPLALRPKGCDCDRDHPQSGSCVCHGGEWHADKWYPHGGGVTATVVTYRCHTVVLESATVD